MNKFGIYLTIILLQCKPVSNVSFSKVDKLTSKEKLEIAEDYCSNYHTEYLGDKRLFKINSHFPYKEGNIVNCEPVLTTNNRQIYKTNISEK